MPLIPTPLLVLEQNVLTSVSCNLSEKQAWTSSNLSIMASYPERLTREAPHAWRPPGGTPASLKVPSCVLQTGCGSIPSGAKAQTFLPQHHTSICPSHLKDTHIQRHQEPKGLATLSMLRDTYASSLVPLPTFNNSQSFKVFISSLSL